MLDVFAQCQAIHRFEGLEGECWKRDCDHQARARSARSAWRREI